MVVRVTSYVRVSTDKQDDSPDRQFSAVDPYISKNGYHVSAPPYIDLNQKGWKDDRPAFLKLLADAKLGKFDRIVVDQGSRLSRQTPTEFFGTVAWPLMQAGVCVESVERGRVLDWNSIGDFLIQSVEQYTNNKESSDTAWRVLGEWCLQAKKGECYLGRNPFGYIKGEKDGRKTLLVGDENDVRVIQFLFDAYVRKDMSLREIRDELTNRGAKPPRGKSWRESTLRLWLRDPVYIGTYRFNRTTYGQFYKRTKDGVVKASKTHKSGKRNPEEDWIIQPDHHEPLVDAELFRQAQELLVKNRKCTNPSRSKRDFTLSGLLVCGRCGCRMTGTKRMKAGTGKVYGVAYRCASSSEAGKCSLNLIREESLLPNILETINGWLTPEKLDDVRQRAEKLVKQMLQPNNLDPQQAEREKLLKQIERGQKNMTLLDNDDDLIVVRDQVKQWRERVKTIDAILGEAERPTALAQLDLVIQEIEKCLWEFRQAEQANDPKLLRATIRRYIREIEVFTEAVPWRAGKNKYRVLGGHIWLESGSPMALELPGGMINLFSVDPTTAQVTTWDCGMVQ